MAVTAQEAAIVNWVFVGLTAAVLLGRLWSIRYVHRRFEPAVPVLLLSLGVLIARVVCNSKYLEYTAAPYSSATSRGGAPDDHEQARIQHAGILTLIARILVTTFYWLQCVLLLLVYRKFLAHVTWIYYTICACWILIATSYFAVLLITLLECRPISLYWQVYPSEPECARAYGQLLTQCLSNIAIDLLLAAIALPLLIEQYHTFPKNLQLGFIYSMGFLCIIISCLRIKFIYEEDSSQSARSLWASVQAMVTAIVANISSIYGGVSLLIRRRLYSTDQPSMHGRGSYSYSYSQDPSTLGLPLLPRAHIAAEEAEFRRYSIK